MGTIACHTLHFRRVLSEYCVKVAVHYPRQEPPVPFFVDATVYSLLLSLCQRHVAFGDCIPRPYHGRGPHAHEPEGRYLDCQAKARRSNGKARPMPEALPAVTQAAPERLRRSLLELEAAPHCRPRRAGTVDHHWDDRDGTVRVKYRARLRQPMVYAHIVRNRRIETASRYAIEDRPCEILGAWKRPLRCAILAEIPRFCPRRCKRQEVRHRRSCGNDRGQTRPAHPATAP